MDLRSRLKEILLAQSYERRNVTLASGRKSDFYFDGKQTALHPEGSYLLGQIFFEMLQKHFPEAMAIGGPTLGADPLVTAVSLVSYQAQCPKPAFIIRKEPKKHGTGVWIEGAKNLSSGMKVVLLEDVVTSGGSLLEAVDKARESQLDVIGTMTIVDREEGGLETIESKGLRLKSIFTKTELLS